MTGALSGLVVLQLGQGFAISYATLLLALGGATVIVIEPPDRDSRPDSEAHSASHNARALLNANKESATLAVETESGRDLFLSLCGRSDVLVEDLGPKRMDELALGAPLLQRRNPRLVYASLTAAGRTHPDLMARDELILQAMTGLMSVTGFPENPPVKAGPAVAETFSGAHLYCAILSALLRRQRTGDGAVIDLSMMEATYPSLMSNVSLVLGRGASHSKMSGREGNRNAGQAVVPYNTYPAIDGWIAIRIASDTHWNALAGLLSDDHLEVPGGLDTMQARVEAIELVDGLVAQWTKLRTVEEAFASVSRVGVPCGPVRTVREVLNHARPSIPSHRGRQTDAAEEPAVASVVTPFRIDGSAPCATSPASNAGDDNEHVYGAWLGLTEERITDLRRRGII